MDQLKEAETRPNAKMCSEADESLWAKNIPADIFSKSLWAEDMSMNLSVKILSGTDTCSHIYIYYWIKDELENNKEISKGYMNVDT